MFPHLQNERGVVGLVILGVVILAGVTLAAIYVSQVRSGESEPLGFVFSEWVRGVASKFGM